jgi:hypothetical protein
MEWGERHHGNGERQQQAGCDRQGFTETQEHKTQVKTHLGERTGVKTDMKDVRAFETDGAV